MKRFLFISLALLGMVACSGKEEVKEEKPDSISVVPENKAFENQGGQVDVFVESTGEWTLSSEDEYEWVEVSAKAGVDGDKVTFTVSPNTEELERKAEYVFMCGKASATFTVTCAKADPKPDDKISLFPESLGFDEKGGKKTISVTSTGDWTLAPKDGAEYDWVTPSVLSGKDGDNVSFTVAANNTLESRTATYVFTTGESAAAELTITCEGLKFFMELTSEEEINLSKEASEVVLTFNTNIEPRDLQQSVQQEGNWLTFNVALAGEGENTAKLVFNAAANETFAPRTATVTVTGVGGLTSEVKVSQAQTDRIYTETTTYYVGLEGGEIKIPVDANVDYTVTPSDSWITHNGKTGNEETFTVASATGNRKGSVTFKGGEAELIVNIEQKTQALIESVANMDGNWAWPAWNNGSVVDNLTELTMEATVNFQDFKSTKEITTIMGIEDYFLLRLGDGANVNNKTLQLVYKGGKAQAQYELPPFQYINKWTHIAIVFKSGKASVYVNGYEYLFAATGMSSVSLGADHNSGTGSLFKPWSFYVGYSYAQGREFKGYMTEVRIWNKALTTSELKAANHQYYVDPASEGLVAYWKFNEPAGSQTVKDHTSNGNDLTLHAPLEAVPVNLP